MLPSPKFHWREVIGPDEASVKATVRGAVPLVGAAVKLATPPERQALVGRVAYERVAEAERASDVRVALDVLAETVPRLRARRDERIVFEDIDDERPREGHTEHGRPAKEGTIAWSQLIDTRRHECLDRLG